MVRGVSNYFSATDPRNADSAPSLDRWGPDFGGYWSANDWITWHRALTAKYGIAVANQSFAAAWNEQDSSSGPVIEAELDPAVRSYFNSVGLGGLVPNTPIAIGVDLLSAAGNATRGLPAAANTVGVLLPYLLIAVGIIYILPSRQKLESAKSLFNK